MKKYKEGKSVEGMKECGGEGKSVEEKERVRREENDGIFAGLRKKVVTLHQNTYHTLE